MSRHSAVTCVALAAITALPITSYAAGPAGVEMQEFESLDHTGQWGATATVGVQNLLSPALLLSVSYAPRSWFDVGVGGALGLLTGRTGIDPFTRKEFSTSFGEEQLQAGYVQARLYANGEFADKGYSGVRLGFASYKLLEEPTDRAIDRNRDMARSWNILALANAGLQHDFNRSMGLVIDTALGAAGLRMMFYLSAGLQLRF